MKVNATTATCDSLAGLTSVTIGRTLNVPNLSGMLTNALTLLFQAGGYSCTFSNITPPPGTSLAWDKTTLATDGILRVSGSSFGEWKTP